ncbi:MAG: WYL domain-containing protein, partial [Candidatus Acidiferrales bacterium]
GLEQAVSVRTLGFKDYGRSKETMAALTRAMLHKFTTRIRHRAAGYEKVVEREVDPYRLWYVNGGIYVVGHDHRSGEIRTFAVERISAAKATNRRFDIPADFDFELFTQNAFGVIYGEPREAKIHFSRGQAPYIAERTRHSSQKIETLADGSLELTLQVANLWEVKRWLIGYGADARVLEPEGLRKEIEEECAKLLRTGKSGNGSGRARVRSRRMRKI